MGDAIRTGVIGGNLSDDHPKYLNHVTDEEQTAFNQHAQVIESWIVDGELVHKIEEQYDTDGKPGMFEWEDSPVGIRCPCCGAKVERKRRSRGKQYGVNVYETVECPECPFQQTRNSIRFVKEGDPRLTPSSLRIHVPHSAVCDEAEMWENLKDDEGVDETVVANVTRRRALREFIEQIFDYEEF